MTGLSVQTCDCAVVGLGAMGSAALYHLARRGQQVVGLEQFATGHDRGSSHGKSRVFRTTYDDPLYVGLAEESLELWRDLERVSRRNLLELTGLLVFAGRDNARFARTLPVLRDAGLPHEVLDGPAASRRFPAFQFDDSVLAFHAERNGFLRVGEATDAMRSAAIEHGAEVVEGTRVESIEPVGSGLRLATSAGTLEAGRVVVTAGPWIGRLLEDLSLPLVVTREQKVHFTVDRPDRFAPSAFPIFCEYDTRNYGFPTLDGRTIKVAADHVGDVVDPDVVDREVDRKYVETMAGWLNRWLPGCVQHAESASVCLYTSTPDHDFLIGRHPADNRLIIGGGFSGHGFKFSILVGDILADLVIDGDTTRPIERFRVDRFALPNSTPAGDSV